MARLLLASSSPRRADLLRAAGYDFEASPSGTDEWPYPGGDPAAYAEALARAKVDAVPGELVIGADTIVVLGGDVLGKPADAEEAASMLRRLSGRTHRVVTAVAVRHAGRTASGAAAAGVTFRPLTDADIDAYVRTGEPMDKAGAYAYQGGAAVFVTALDGDADTVIGLPLRLLAHLLPPAERRARPEASSPWRRGR